MAHLDGADNRQQLQKRIKGNPDATLDLQRLHAHLHKSTCLMGNSLRSLVEHRRGWCCMSRHNLTAMVGAGGLSADILACLPALHTCQHHCMAWQVTTNGRVDLDSDEVADHLSEGFRDKGELLGQGLDDQPHILQPDSTPATSSSRCQQASSSAECWSSLARSSPTRHCSAILASWHMLKTSCFNAPADRHARTADMAIQARLM